VSGEIDDDESELARERCRMRLPARPAAGEAVQKEQRDPGTADPDLPAEIVDDDAAPVGDGASASASVSASVSASAFATASAAAR
jgi:hypothetical protein